MTHHRFVRPREMTRLQQWAVRETAVDVSFVTTPDGWQLAVSHYRSAAHGPATRRHPVLLCHGLGANRLTFDADPRYSLAAWLVAQGFDVYAVELRGHGLSEKPGGGKRWGWGIAEYAEIDLPAVFAHVLELTQKEALHYVGHSMGGILLYTRSALGDTNIRSGVTIGSSLDYSGLPSMFHAVAPLAPLSYLLSFVPVHWGALLSSWATRFSARWVDASLVNGSNVELDVFRRMAANLLHPVSSRVLRDLALAITGRGMKSSGGSTYNELLQERGYGFPVLSIAGAGDILCPPETVARFGTETHAFARAHGHQADYGHLDLVMGLHAEREVWPLVNEWLLKHD